MAMSQDAIIVLNAGSSSVKFSLFVHRGEALELRLRGQLESLFNRPHFIARDAGGQTLAEKTWTDGTQLGHDGALAHLITFLRETGDDLRLIGVGHRVVHGGLAYSQPVRVDEQVLCALDKYVSLAPLHQPHNLAAIRAVAQRAPDLPQVACFDTAFHRGNPEIAQMFALPYALHEAGVRRYGFHGLSYEYIASVLPQLDARAAAGRTVVLHLGSGASMCALAAGRSVASTMGFTAIDGLPMGTRTGNLDPGVVLWLMDERGMDARGIERMLYQQSGLLGVSGVSNDMRTLLVSDDPRAQVAIDLFVYRVGRELGSLAAALGGLDAIVFTAGVGENSPAIRERVCRAARWLGVELDEAANATGGPCISTRESRVTAWTVPTNEELMIARHAAVVLSATHEETS
jgi:acetate kinase